MGAQSNAAPVIIKRKKVVAGGGHHGGAWKVAYADFVTAMMAFFMLMWLLNATTEKQRKGIADYFSPIAPISRMSGGGDAMFGGDSVFTKETLAKNGVGGMPTIGQLAAQTDEEKKAAEIAKAADEADQKEGFARVENFLIGSGGESLISENALKHVVTRQTDEGLVIEIFDLDDLPLFVEGKGAPYGELLELVRVIAGAVSVVENGIAVEGYLRSEPLVLAEKNVWALSSERAGRVRSLLESHGIAPERFDRVTGHADRDRVASDPRSTRNNRIEIVLLRSDQG